MPLWQWLLDSVGFVLLLVLAYGVALIVRRRYLSRHGGTLELSHRVRDSRAGRGWVLGLGRYTGDELQWFRIFSLSPRPRRTWRRIELSYVGQRDSEGPEGMSLYSDHVIVTCTLGSDTVELAMSKSSLTGFQAWLESGPPGSARHH